MLITLGANGDGGNGGSGITGGNGGEDGGEVLAELYSGTITAAYVSAMSRTEQAAMAVTAATRRGLAGSAETVQAAYAEIHIGSTLNGDVFPMPGPSADRETGTIAGNGGIAEGGTADLNVLSTGQLNGDATVYALAVGGDGANGGNAYAGSASVDVQGVLDGSTVTIDSDAVGGTGTSASGNATAGSSSLESRNGGSITADSLTLTAQGDFDTGSVSIDAGTNCDCSLGTIAAGDLTLLASSDLNIPTIGDNITVSGNLKLATSANLTFADVTAGSLRFDVGGSVNGGNIDVTDQAIGEAGGAIVLGNITTEQAPPPNSIIFTVGIVSNTSITVGDVNSPGAVGFATYGPLTTGNIGAGDLFMALVGGDISLGSVATASNGDVYIGDVSMFDRQRRGPDNFDANVGPRASSGRDRRIDHHQRPRHNRHHAGRSRHRSDAGRVDASQSVDFTAGGLADFEGTVSAPTITVTSGDINVAAGASLGVYGITDLLTLNAVSDQPIVIGNGAETGRRPICAQRGRRHPGRQYRLQRARHRRRRRTPTSTSTMRPSTAASHAGRRHQQRHHQHRQLDHRRRRARLSLTPRPPTRSRSMPATKIEVVTDAGGSIAMTDNLGDLSGTLNLTAHDVWVADQAIIDQLEMIPITRAATPISRPTNGPDNQAGYLQAGGIAVDLLGSSSSSRTAATQ